MDYTDQHAPRPLNKGTKSEAAAWRSVAERHFCRVCGKRFSGIATAIYCSNACRQKAKYQRKK